jgi:predicted nucleic acid-binding protein
MSVLVDSSVWIRFLLNRLREARELDCLLAENQVMAHQLVYGELLIGDKGGRSRLLKSYSKLHYAPSVPHEEVVRFVTDRRLFGRGVGWVDVHLVASAIVAGVSLWTADPRLEAVAQECGVAHAVRRP